MEKNVQINKGNYSLDTEERELTFEKNRALGIEEAYYSYRKNWSDYPVKQYVSEYPLLVDLELASVCNLSCPFCYTITEEFKSRVKKGLMDFSLFKKIIDEIGGKVPAVRLSLRGEPTLHPDFINCIKYAKDKGIKEVSFLTNGSKLNLDFFEKVMLAGADWITVSFDGLYEEYEKNRYPLKFDEMFKKLEDIVEIKKKFKSVKPVIKIQSVWPAIVKNPTEFYEKMSRVSDLIAFNPLIDFNHIIPFEEIPFEEEFICPMLYQRLVVSSNGSVMMCSNDEEENNVIGNAYEKSIYEIWNSDELNSIRAIHREVDGFKKIGICKKCYLPRKTTEELYSVQNREFIVKNYK